MNPAPRLHDAAAVYRRLLGYARPHWRMFLVGVLGMVMYASVSTLTAWFVKNFLNAAFVAKNLQMLRYVPVGIVLLFLMRGVGDYMANYLPGLGRPADDQGHAGRPVRPVPAAADGVVRARVLGRDALAPDLQHRAGGRCRDQLGHGADPRHARRSCGWSATCSG